MAMGALDAAVHRRETAHQAYAYRLLGEIAARSQPPIPVEAETSYHRALALAERCEMRPLLAHCHLGLGKLFRRTDRPGAAQHELSTAITMFGDMEMTFWLPEAEQELAAAQPTRPSSAEC